MVHVETYTSKRTEREPLFNILIVSSNNMDPIANVTMGDDALHIIIQMICSFRKLKGHNITS